MITYDLRALQSANYSDRGIARFVADLAKAIERVDNRIITSFAIDSSKPVSDVLSHFTHSGKLHDFRNLRSENRILHVTSPFDTYENPFQVFAAASKHLVVNLYDLIPLLFPDEYLSDRRIESWYKARLGIFSIADAILADSESASNDAQRLLNIDKERISVIGAGHDDVFKLPDCGRLYSFRQAQQSVVNLRLGFLLFPTGMDWRKNIEGTIRAYSRLPISLRRRHQLVIVTRITQSERNSLEKLLAEYECERHVLITGFVSDSVLVSLYQAAHLVIFPSRYEGFGLPVLEALACGSTVLCGDNSSLKEIQPDPMMRWDANDSEGWTRLIQSFLVNPSLNIEKRTLSPPSFSWLKAAERTIEVYEELLASSRYRSRNRARIALVSPFPPIRSGIADYSFELAQELAANAHLYCFSDQVLETCKVPSGAVMQHLSDLRRFAANSYFDYVVYVLGNNPIHTSALRMLAEVPGFVHLHDVRLVGCYLEDSWPDVVRRHYPQRFSKEDLESLESPWSDLIQKKNIFLLRDVANHALGVLTNSDYARRLVELDTGFRNIENIGCLAMKAYPRPVLAGSPVNVISAGIFDDSKQSFLVLQAFEILRSRRPTVNCTIIGETPPGVRSSVVEFTGYLNENEYHARLSNATIAVQLRKTSNGESSGAIADCLSHGISCIVSNLGAQAELPDEVVLKTDPSISAERLVLVIEGLIDDAERRQALSRSSLNYALANSFEVAALKMRESITRMSRIKSST